MKPISVGSALVLAFLVWRSLDWPLVHDAPLMHYVAWLVGHGAVPYRDVFDMNLPGVYLVHWAVLRGLGAGDLAWRLFDLGWLAATAAALWAYCRPLGGAAAGALAGLLFALYHVAGGAWRAGQRDFLVCVFLLVGAHGVARSLERAGAIAPLVWGGLALGAAMMIKPYAGIFWLVAAVVAAVGGWRARRSPARPAAAVLAAGLVVPFALLGWIAWRGGLGAFVAVLGSYVLPLYSRVGRASVWEALGWHRYGLAVLALSGGLAAIGAVTSRGAASPARRWLVLAGIGYGALHFVLPGKGWEYHLYPLALFLCALAPAALAPARADHRRWAGPARARRAVALVGAAALVVVLGAKGVDAVDAEWIADKERMVAALVADLRPLAPPGRTVQVMDTTAGGIHALLRLGLREPTRFIYDFHFFHDEADPRIQALRAEFVAGLAGGAPAAVVVMRDSWPRPGYERLDRFPELSRLLAARYTLAREADGYRIYARRSDP